MPDADMEVTISGIMGSAFGAAGQRCLAGSVAVLVGDEKRQTAVRDALAAAAAELVTGPGSEEGTDVCPVIAPEARERIAAAIDRALGEGAELVLDGRDAEGPSGSWLAPCILEVSDRESEPAREELFGPLLTLVRADDLDDALEFVNGSRYGNAGSIFTTSGAAARAYRAGVETGMIGVNVGVAAPVAWFPFSGWDDSIDGDLHANGSDAVDFYTRRKVATSRW
jgi:malonate-semialdehyde dehydrogenase (acetylating)/methylmalonate-semialdehyde dehydrogenase